ncbi:TM2 domain-containing protein [Metabacillus sp. RGM 3146]|uniref:TM2 domain-containing protein n=1 Tax=Metabacillus sp. RGM 3146 TaxID=3401092 RepID=UPI003B9CC395
MLCLFFGGIGAHKFYLGHTSSGVMFQLFSLTAIPLIISFFNLLGLIFMSEKNSTIDITICI